MKKHIPSFIISTVLSLQLSICVLVLSFQTFDDVVVNAWSSNFLRRMTSFTPPPSSSASSSASSLSPLQQGTATSSSSKNNRPRLRFFSTKPSSDAASASASSLKDQISTTRLLGEPILSESDNNNNNVVAGRKIKRKRLSRATNIIKVPIAMIAKRRQGRRRFKKKFFRYNDVNKSNIDNGRAGGDFSNIIIKKEMMEDGDNNINNEYDDYEVMMKLAQDISKRYSTVKTSPLKEYTFVSADNKISSNIASFKDSSTESTDVDIPSSDAPLSSTSKAATLTSKINAEMKSLQNNRSTKSTLSPSSVSSSSSASVSTTTKKKVMIRTVEQLQEEVLDKGKKLQELDFDVSSFTTKAAKKRAINNSNKLSLSSTNETVEQVGRSSINSNTIHAGHGQNNTTLKASGSDVAAMDDLPFNHEVLKLIEERYKAKSKPGSRSDTSQLALSIEGGGMRGAVSAGMASAIAVLGLSDCFDSVYGSSAGSVVGAYMISRQMCIDVYTQVLTTAKTKFVSKTRLASSLVSTFIGSAVNNTIFSPSSSSASPSSSSSKKTTPPLLRRRPLPPAMNISYVLDSIMCPEKGLRPLDVETFQLNDKLQQLRIVTSCLKEGKMETHCLGSRDGDFFDAVHNSTGEVLESATTMVLDEKDGDRQQNVPQRRHRHGLFACLETSMTVPAATGPPLPLLRNKDSDTNTLIRCFDAFCYEPIPYRSAVKEGATHVLVLKTRPEGNVIGTKPGLFEKIFAPNYFNKNDMPQVSKFFENGGQQYIYVEDYLVLDKGKTAGPEGVSVPPTKILYGVEKDDTIKSYVENRDQWKKAHLLPISVPPGTPELSTLSVDENQVVEAVQYGFAAAFDLLAPITGIQLDSHLNGQRVAELIFSADALASADILENPVPIAGDPIVTDDDDDNKDDETFHHINAHSLSSEISINNSSTVNLSSSGNSPCPKQDSANLVTTLPGFSNGKMDSLSRGLYQQIQQPAK